MRRWLVAAGLVLGGRASADPPAPAPDPKAQADADAELRRMADLQAKGMEGEQVIEIFDQRPKKIFDRDTEVRLTGKQLAERGVIDLGSALKLLADVTVRDAGRGGYNVDIRGGRKGAVTILVDGVSVTDPFYGTFDVSTIPITDIVQIRIAPTPQSPIDGPGGPGGVIEVVTRDAIGAQQVIARLSGDSLPSFGMTGMARVALARHLALRISGGGLIGSRDHPLPGATTLDEARHTATGSSRLEYRDGDRRVVLDGFLDSRHYISPPSDTEKGDILVVDRETSARVSTKVDDKIDELQLQGQAWTHYLLRRSRHFGDVALENQNAFEGLSAIRTGGLGLITHPIGKLARWAASASVNRESADVQDTLGRHTQGDATIVELAGDLQYERKRVRVDGAVGAAIPFGIGADPWPEAKLVAKYKPRNDLELTATGGRKGRLPSLRERFALDTGNPALGPEKAWHAELRAVEQIGERLKVEVAPFYRRTTGTIRLVAAPTAEDPDAMISGNLGRLTLLGADASAHVQAHRMLEVGGSYGYLRARSDAEDPALAMAPLDRLPAHHGDGWAKVTPDPRLSVLARVHYTGASYDKGTRIAGYSEVEATVTSPITKEYLGVLRIEDLTNVAPETRAGYHTPGRVISLVIQGSWE